MGTNLGAPPAAGPKFSAHSAEEQEAWLPPMAVVAETADIPTAAVVACTPTGAGKGALCGPVWMSQNLCGLLLEDPAAGAFLFFSAL